MVALKRHLQMLQGNRGRLRNEGFDHIFHLCIVIGTHMARSCFPLRAGMAQLAVHRPEQYRVCKLKSSAGYSISSVRYCQ